LKGGRKSAGKDKRENFQKRGTVKMRGFADQIRERKKVGGEKEVGEEGG